MQPSSESSSSSSKKRKSLKATIAANSVQVAIRIRPFNARERKLDSDAEPIVKITSPNHCVLTEPSTQNEAPFTFDYCFGSDSTQQEVYDQLGSKMIDDALMGYNVCIFAYGQTGSGKSHTMIGGKDDEGLVPRIAKELFRRIDEAQKNNTEMSFEVNTSMIEIYNEQIRDLRVINKKKKDYKPLQLRQHPVMGVYVQDVKWIIVDNHEELQREFDMANKAKTVHNTMMNKSSSRAHTVFELKLTQQKKYTIKGKEFTEKKISKINLIDLAGSERSKKTQVETGGARFKEGVNINLSLTTLGRVIKALSEGQKPPYRESVLTLLLKSSLGGNSKTYMISALSPHPNNFSETKSTLDYSKRAKKIQNKAKVNEDANILKDLKAEIDALKQQLQTEQKSKERAKALEEKLSQSNNIIEELKQSIQATRDEKLKESQEIQKAREKALRETGLSVTSVESMLGVDIRTLPSLVNLDEDSLQSGCLFYYLREGITTLGRSDTCNIKLMGFGVQEKHCEMEYNTETRVVIMRPLLDAKVLVNGDPIGQASATTLQDDRNSGDEESPPKEIELHSSDRIIIGDRWTFRFQNPHEKSRKTQELIDWEFAQREKFKQEEIRFKKQQEAKLQELEQQRKQVELDMQQIDETMAKFKAEEEKMEETKKRQKVLEESVSKYERLLDEEKSRTDLIQKQLLHASQEREDAERRVREEHERYLAEEQSRTESEKQQLLEQKNIMEQQLQDKQKAEQELKSKYKQISGHVSQVKKEIDQQREEKQLLETQLHEQAALVSELQHKEKEREAELKRAQETLEKEKEHTQKKLQESQRKSDQLSESVDMMKKEAQEAKEQIQQAKGDRDRMQALFDEKLKEQENMREQYEKMLAEKDLRMKEINDSLQREKEHLEQSNQEMKRQMEERQREIAHLESNHQSILTEKDRTQQLIKEGIEEKENLIAEQKMLFEKQKEATEKEREELSKLQTQLESKLKSKGVVERDLRQKLDLIEQESSHSKMLVEEQKERTKQLKEELEKQAQQRENLLKQHHEELLQKEVERSDMIQQQLLEEKQRLEQKERETEEYRQALRLREDKEKQLEQQYEDLQERSQETSDLLAEETAQKESLQQLLENQQMEFDEMIEKQNEEHQAHLRKLEEEKQKILNQLTEQQKKEKTLEGQLQQALGEAQCAQQVLTKQNTEKQELLSRLEENENMQLGLSEKVEEMEVKLREQEVRENFLKEEHQKLLEEEREKTRQVQKRLMESKQTEENQLQILLASMKEKLRKTEAKNSEYRQVIDKLSSDVENHELEKRSIQSKNEQLRTERDTLNYRLVSNLDAMQHELGLKLRETQKMREETLELRKRIRELERELEFEKQMPLQIRMRFNQDTFIRNMALGVYFSVDDSHKTQASPGSNAYLMMHSGKIFRSSSQMMVFHADGYISPKTNPNFVLTVTEFVENAPIQLLPRVQGGEEKGAKLTRNHQRWFFFETKSSGSKERTLIIASMAHLEWVISCMSKGRPALLEKFNPSRLQQRWILKK
uniref:Kinesin motor domain-containing protein n=1 Tax=Percolomonas cosmopolitus TaxID=63605 RepID=A0A6U0JIR4_9EUKA|mmetsp:Transcript_10208/g.37932  ORF Transcript_10208/g.37932 Transcript_10208/m.37932 type:complete len:1525 (+) Transcript_10208:194-4768(+)|eukprot:CAMPEP_0117435778 /NCGR_PEP_ID=MMETSP0759-20121206/659_1 /TAXON_ID=63605 /ORGANISM="Percolomonas cosmopolitus, Strain WS" /LENGTH=1524 /DNA_ID=CAMNT_0005227341 /DNA_START=153 /DNA_END=4727 /DNA_ORIENTATION=+